ncbi:hypothetical protein IW139_002829 [Coemansia sp. RSA 353]|nr:hypothetical protein LPJ62_000192 [Coemansia sp. RSA 2167]KAJ2152362.1 hypothetical protein GGH15_006131 [Coemansia sp. RSA 562]KAJ2154190.1 hypothetical protein J3F82_001411 [Coemansia sp. RSA 637]KAJ2189782.1 hypothetical protein GGH18_003391 [Coemansia sp. RSA 530]KAJ2196015.1 hypothetical protein IW144_003148 [Coemansia sp. RSA 522]KAJ2205467.1 hypothetical protein IW145_002777 [Coemansia sp. RSA 521]KAJ2225869.1 hypothetical protein EV180_003194 [Coemansia sp. RSA 518]KAJ2273265.1 hy
MILPNVNTGFVSTPLPRFGATRHTKNPLIPSKEQTKGAPEVAFPGPFSPAFSTVDTIPLDHGEEDYQQVLQRIRETRSDCVVAGQKITDAPNPNAQADNPEIVNASLDSESSYYSD